MLAVDHLLRYAQRIRDLRRAHPAVSEPGIAPAFQELLTSFLTSQRGADLTVVPEFNNPGVGRPDIALMRAGQPARAFVELKALDKSVDPKRWRSAHDKRQAMRLAELQCWATSNFVDVLLFERGEERGSARIVPEQSLDPARSDAAAERLIRRHDSAPFVALVDRLAVGAGTAPAARDAKHLAELLAHSARLVRGIVQDRLAELRAGGTVTDPLLDVHAEFQSVLYAHPEAGGYPAHDFDILFSSAFAQTLAFGLLLVREGSSRPIDATAYRHMPAEHPLMRTALRVLTQAEILDAVGIGFSVLLDTVNCFTPDILAVRASEPDPILYFYEDFLSVFDPAARERHGVYFTPVDVVRYMVAALDRSVREHLALAGLRDPALTILDPATGTGTFLLGIVERVRSQAQSSGGIARAELELRALAGRMFALELLVGPYAVAHYRLHHALHIAGAPAGQAPARLGIYLADTLSEPGAAAPLDRLGLVSQGIADERRAADRVKAHQPILAIIGNPPYRRLEEGEDRTLVGPWMNAVWDDLKGPVRDAGQGNQLNTFPELSVAFWRWAMWKLFDSDEAPRRGVVAYITNRKFLTGWPYAGLRRMMRERFDRIEIIDLRGDVRRGPRAGVDRDVGVFDIQVGTAITIAIADGSRQGQGAEVFYLDSWAEGYFARSAKLDWLARGTDDGRLANAVQVARGALDDFRPRPFGNGEWPSLSECFAFHKSGMKSGNDPVFVDADRRRLKDKVAAHLVQKGRGTHSSALVQGLAYRPLDQRCFYNDVALLNRAGPELQRVWGVDNAGLYALPGGTGRGPAVWCHRLLPDYHAFRGSYGGYAFPLHDRRPEVNDTNIARPLIDGLCAAYGTPVEPEQVFHAVLCLLSARGYTLRFAEDLEDVFPHVPFPADYAVFERAASLGVLIRANATFDVGTRPAAIADARFVHLLSAPKAGASLAASHPDGSRLTLCTDGLGVVEGLPPRLWAFEVSGYPVLARWLEARRGLPLDLTLFDAFRDVCARIDALIELAEQADAILESALTATLNRDALGMPTP